LGGQQPPRSSSEWWTMSDEDTPLSPEAEVHDWLNKAGNAIKDKDTPLGFEDLADNAIGDFARKEEERLVQLLFDRIRNAEVEVHNSRVSMEEDKEDLLGDMETSTERHHRIDAGGEQLNMDHIYDALEAAERAGGHVEADFEWWLHPKQLHGLRHREEQIVTVAEASKRDGPGTLHGAQLRTFPQFPRAAVLLLDPEVLVPEHGVGSRVPQGVQIRDPRKVVRITSLGL